MRLAERSESATSGSESLVRSSQSFSMWTISKTERHLYQSGQLQLDPQKRQLFRETKVVSLTPRVIETLLLLVENRDRGVPNDELMKLVWPDSLVEESNLSQNVVSALPETRNLQQFLLPNQWPCVEFADIAFVASMNSALPGRSPCSQLFISC